MSKKRQMITRPPHFQFLTETPRDALEESRGHGIRSLRRWIHQGLHPGRNQQPNGPVVLTISGVPWTNHYSFLAWINEEHLSFLYPLGKTLDSAIIPRLLSFVQVQMDFSCSLQVGVKARVRVQVDVLVESRHIPRVS